MELTLKGKRALVTGANGGLGSHFAHTLARAGADVAIAARRLESLTPVRRSVEAMGGKVAAVALDVTRAESIAAAFDEAAAALGPLTVVVNNAGIAITKPLLDHTEDDWQQVIEVNLNGAWRVAQAAARHMVAHQQGGSIVNIASILGLRVSAQVPSYAASKAALIQLTKAMALELARHRIRVNALAPGYIETGINDFWWPTEGGQKQLKGFPRRRLMQESDLDAAFQMLVGPAAKAIAGSVIVIDDGQSLPGGG